MKIKDYNLEELSNEELENTNGGIWATLFAYIAFEVIEGVVQAAKRGC